MEVDFSGDFINFKSTKDGDIMIIIDEGKLEYNEILKKEMFNIGVEMNGKKKIYSPTNEAGRLLQIKFGKDSKDWLGKKIQIVHAGEKMLIRPLVDEKQ